MAKKFTKDFHGSQLSDNELDGVVGGTEIPKIWAQSILRTWSGVKYSWPFSFARSISLLYLCFFFM